MSGNATSLDRFLRAVHRRHVAVRVLERAGLGLLGACAVAAALAAVMIWRRLDAWAVVGATLTLGAIVGAAWGVVARPSLLEAATEADRQLRTADLLGTAWAVARHGGRDPFQQAVLALAADRCAGLNPSAVVLHRLGARTWGGIGLAVAFVATLATMSAAPLRAGTEPRDDANATPARDGRRTAATPIVELTAGEPRADRDRSRPDPSAGESREIHSTTRPATAPSDDHDASATAEPNRTAGGETAPSGAGSASAAAPDAPNTNTSPSPLPRAIPASQPAPQAGRAAAGRGSAANDPGDNGRPAGGTTDVAASQPAPWQAADWSHAVQSAERDVQAGRVPDDYRDLVRQYFTPATTDP